MMARVGAVAWLLLLFCVSCGGATHSSDTDVVGATGGASTDDTVGQAGDDTAPGSTCSGSGPSCLSDCASFETVTDSVCVGAQWTCPAGTQAYDDCPANACVRRTQSCCAPNGSVALPDCTDAGVIAECPQGFATVSEKCLPQGVPIADCSELQHGQACTDAKLVCYTSKCGRNCTCKEDEAGNLTWNCYALPC